MHSLTFISMRGTTRRPIALLALLCIVGILVSLVQPSFARGFSKAEPAQAAFAQSHSVNGGKPCKRVVPGAVGTLCSVSALIGLEINTSAVADPSHSRVGILPYADKRLEVQWLAAPQYRPPRIDA
ncbi:MAG TPA: hypothetical protein DEA80_19295 [Afipia sp.]|nr:hypothetical protein [Afipia sp.]OUX60238.1 MAG: hypothetical protein CBB64_16395 [Afipia sp. TMED4]HAP12527.1 hypothetical protein [Afipia sp.]HAQ94591.1 hypothetical protein [Afipia sp.]HBF53139.1 hypothetical protein [Afipia sp.]